ncbi:mitochondrial inner membrane protein OXA1L-like isoform X2 [Daktulosphaira vitifoliae]|uniref:mitochondrial inner membrane protein OXA1L-like isoform X2 n=1 Tax=Daktulosphaira vitifoliae TaxID=58002 RepID=UPI0021A97B83|nr:mitochondrial inner membrane protein OXA1L-like isoform X2 [Daktulosphaira vitifoliae]
MSYSKIMNKARILQFIQRPTIKQKCNFSRLITSNSLTLNKSCSFQKVAEIRSVIATNIAFVRYNSNESDQSVERIEVTDDVIPEPPEVPNEVVEPVEKVLNVLGEETLESAGLGSWTPVGILQNALQYMHVSFDMPWWLTIIAGTAILRLLVFPLVISSQRHTIKMNNNMPKIQEYQQKISECRLQGNPYEMARASQELMLFMKSNHVNPIKGMILPAIQFPIFLSMFLGLRGMAMLPLESLTYGGLWWFTDLTLPDQFFILPIVTVATLGLTIEAVCLYWASTNFISLTQVMFLRIPKVRKYFNIEEKKKFEKPKTKKGLIGDFKDSWKNMQVVREIEERERLDHMKFTQAGRAPPVKTYKYNPTVAGGLKQEKQ